MYKYFQNAIDDKESYMQLLVNGFNRRLQSSGAPGVFIFNSFYCLQQRRHIRHHFLPKQAQVSVNVRYVCFYGEHS